MLGFTTSKEKDSSFFSFIGYTRKSLIKIIHPVTVFINDNETKGFMIFFLHESAAGTVYCVHGK